MSYEKKYKGLLIFVAIIIFFWLFIALINVSTSETNLDRANNCISSKDYEGAVTYYEKAILDGYRNCKLFALLGFSLEKTSSDEELMKNCYKLAVYFYNPDSSSNDYSKYYNYALKKINELGIENNASDEDIKNIQKYLMEKHNITYLGRLIDSGEIIFYLIVFFIVYIIALIVGGKTNCVIVYGKIDGFLLFLPCIAFFLLNNVSLFALNIVFLIWLIISAIFSIKGNALSTKGNIFLMIIYTLLSLLTKIVLVFLLPIMVLIIFAEIASAKSDKRYKDGTKNNQKTAIIAEAGILFSFLVLPLIKEKDDF